MERGTHLTLAIAMSTLFSCAESPAGTRLSITQNQDEVFNGDSITATICVTDPTFTFAEFFIIAKSDTLRLPLAGNSKCGEFLSVSGAPGKKSVLGFVRIEYDAHNTVTEQFAINYLVGPAS